MKKRIIISSFLLLMLIISSFFIYSKAKNQVCINNHCFIVELAKTDEERKKGLMFKEELGLNEGMLFVFEKEGEYSFWMKDVLIPLDIIWINESKEVVFISKNNQPCEKSFCPSINPNKKAKYVLELNEGVADKINLKIRDKAIFDIN